MAGEEGTEKPDNTQEVMRQALINFLAFQFNLINIFLSVYPMQSIVLGYVR